MRKLLHSLGLATALAASSIAGVSQGAPGASNGAGGWEPSADHMESVVISLKTDPLIDPEAACVALQIGMNLLMDTIEVEGNYVPVTRADRVTLFPTLGGVELINPANDLGTPVCFTPAGPASRSIAQLLQGFVNLGGEVVVCPLCALGRGITEPTHGVMGSGVEIHNLFLNGDKVIDF